MTRAEELADMCAVKVLHSDYKTAQDLTKIILIAVTAAQREERQRCAEVIKDAIRHNWRFAGHAKGLRDVLMEIEKPEDA